MAPLDRSTLNAVLDDIAFLANSGNRVAVLDSLTDGPHSRHVLTEQTSASRVTLGRILDDLEDRHWISQSGQICEITPLGEWVLEEFYSLVGTMAAERGLRQAFQWFPDAGYDFHVSHLASADVTLVSRADASAPISTLVREFEVGGRVYAFSFAITSHFLEACWRHVVAGDVTWEWVFTPEVLDVLASSPTMASQSREMLETGNAEFYRYDGEIPYVVICTEETVNLRLADDDGSPTALIQSAEDGVRTWAEETFEGYRREATPVASETFEG